MIVYWDATCLSHDPPHEILSGRLVPYLESPDRVRKIKQSLEEDDAFQILPADDDWPDISVHILAVHSHDYLQYLETIYEEWVAVGGDKVEHILHSCIEAWVLTQSQTAVFPETFRHRQLQNVPIPDVKRMSPWAKPGEPVTGVIVFRNSLTAVNAKATTVSI